MKQLLTTVFTIILLHQTASAQVPGVNCEDMEPFSSWIKLPGNITLNYREQGNKNGLPVILIHGFTDSFHSYDSLMPQLDESFHLYAVSMRGFGNSDKPQTDYLPEHFARDISQFMNVLKIQSAVLIGHSMGATIVERFAMDYPSKTKAIILMSSVLHFDSNAIVKELRDAILGMEKIDYKFAYDFQRSSIDKMIDSCYFKVLVNESMKAPAHVWKMVIKGLSTVNYSAELKRIKVPALILFGEKDGLCKMEEQKEFQREIQKSVLITYNDLGHTPHWENPKKVADDINTFLESLSKD